MLLARGQARSLQRGVDILSQYCRSLATEAQTVGSSQPDGLPGVSFSSAEARTSGHASTSQAQALATGLPRLNNPSLPMPRIIVGLGKKAKRVPIDLEAAIKEVKANVKCKFDESVEVHMRLGTDPRRGDQQVRGATVLPFGTGKAVRVCVFAEGEAAEAARKAGAEVVGADEVIDKVKEGEIDFDKCLATPDMMPRLSKVARILGPKGLMPNPKLGTLVQPVGIAGAIQTMKAGRVEYRADKGAVVHAGIGKASFPPEHLYANLGAFTGAILGARPKGVKGSGASGYILGVHLTSTMGKGVPVTVPSVTTAMQRSRRP